MEGVTKAEMNASSLIDLKAELFRKQEEFKRQKLENAGSSFIKGKTSSEQVKPDIWSKKNAGILERAQRDFEQKVEEENVLDRSRRALEAKAKLYEKITSSSEIPDEDGSGLYLVDFQKKAIDGIALRRQEKLLKDQEEAESVLNSEIPPPSSQDEEWVDYVDSKGVSRRCLRKDLPDLLQQSPHTGRPQLSASEMDTPLSSTDAYREMLRRKWEQEAEDALKNPDIHYSNVQFDEIRSHGVGFYQFAKDSDVRSEQMELLHQLRQRTVDERAQVEKVKEKRKAMLDARLAKVRKRQRIKAGLPEEEEEAEVGPKLEEHQGDTDKEAVIDTTIKLPAKEPELLTRDDSWRKSAPMREWDKGKQESAAWSEEKYLNSRREERDPDFAPPNFYKQQEKRPQMQVSQLVKGLRKTQPSKPWKLPTTAESFSADVGGIQQEDMSTNVLYPQMPEFCIGDSSVTFDRENRLREMGNLPSNEVETQPTYCIPNILYPQMPEFCIGDSSVTFDRENHHREMGNLPLNAMETQPKTLTPVETSAYGDTVKPRLLLGEMDMLSHQLPQNMAFLHQPARKAGNVPHHYKANPPNKPASKDILKASVVDTRFIKNQEHRTQYKFAMHTENLPGHLQPNTEIEARPYKFGSFMAAKKAAFEKSERDLEAIAHKTQFSSEPVIYMQPKDPEQTQHLEYNALWFEGPSVTESASNSNNVIKDTS